MDPELSRGFVSLNKRDRFATQITSQPGAESWRAETDTFAPLLLFLSFASPAGKQNRERSECSIGAQCGVDTWSGKALHYPGRRYSISATRIPMYYAERLEEIGRRSHRLSPPRRSP